MKIRSPFAAALLTAALIGLPGVAKAAEAEYGSAPSTSTRTERTAPQQIQRPAAKPVAKAANKQRPTLKYGKKSKHVKSAQKRLMSLGYFVPRASGRFDLSTKQAVWALQKAAGIRRTGTINASTWKALDRGVRPKAKTKRGTVIEVNIGRQLLLVVKNGKVIKTLNTSTGRAGWRTPRGSYRLLRQINGPRYSKLGYLYRPKYFKGGYAIHGEMFDVPPRPASHGCVRVSNPAMNWLWKSGYAKLGTKVRIY